MVSRFRANKDTQTHTHTEICIPLAQGYVYLVRGKFALMQFDGICTIAIRVFICVICTFRSNDTKRGPIIIHTIMFHI